MVGWSPPSQIWLNYFYDQSKIGLLFYRTKNKQKQRSMNNFQVLFPLGIILDTKQKKISEASPWVICHKLTMFQVCGHINCSDSLLLRAAQLGWSHFPKSRTQFIHKTKRHDCEQLLKKIDGLIKSGNSRNNAHSSHGPGAWTSGLLLARKPNSK